MPKSSKDVGEVFVAIDVRGVGEVTLRSRLNPTHVHIERKRVLDVSKRDAMEPELLVND